MTHTRLNKKRFKPTIGKQHYSLQLNDHVRCNRKKHIVKGIHCKGASVVISDLIKNFSVNIKKVELISYGKRIFN